MTKTLPTTEIELAGSLVRLSHLVQHVFADVSRQHDLTPQQAQLLCVLMNGPLGMSELGRVLHLEKSSLSGLVDRVVRRALATRGQHRTDRRTSQVSLTDEGRALAHATHDGITAELATLLADLPPANRTRLGADLTHLLAGTHLA
jgi:DNA-binding MarR family transcriptional regulator